MSTRVARAPLPIDPSRVQARGAALLILLSACSHAPSEPAGGAPAGSAVFSRDTFAPPPGDAGSGDPPVPASADPAVLDEILAAAPRPGGSPGRDPVALLGTDTGMKGDAGVAEAPAATDPAKGARIRVGKLSIEPGMSSPAIERAARAQLYWPLVQRCRAEDGALLPPEVVRLTFHLDRDGYVVPATILAIPKERRFADAARCMARELSMATFRAPASARGLPQTVSMDVPSVD